MLLRAISLVVLAPGTWLFWRMMDLIFTDQNHNGIWLAAGLFVVNTLALWGLLHPGPDPIKIAARKKAARKRAMLHSRVNSGFAANLDRIDIN